MVACEFSGFCRRYWSMRRRAGSCILVPGPPRRAPIGARASRETRNVNRPRSVVRFQRLRLMHLKTAHRPPPTARQSSDSCRYQVWRNRIEAGPLSRCIKITLEAPRDPLRGGLSIAGSWRPEPEPSSDSNLSPPQKGHQRPTTRDCSAARFLDSACWAAARENCSVLATDGAPASSAWLPAGDHWGSVPAWSVGGRMRASASGGDDG